VPAAPASRTAANKWLLKVVPAATLLVACGSSPTQPAFPLSMTATVNGEVWNAIHPHVAYHEIFQQLSITGNQPDGSGGFRNIYLWVWDADPAPGAYPLGAAETGGDHATCTVSAGGTDTQYSTAGPSAGTLVITELDPDENIIRGTFSFTARTVEGNEVSVTAGSFDGTYQEVTPWSLACAGGTMADRRKPACVPRAP
jgi:hypothetical protein